MSSANDTRILRLTNLQPTLDPSFLEQTIHQIFSLKVKGINTRSLSTTHSVPVVFFDPRDARSVLDSISSGSPLLDILAISPNDPVSAQMISVNQLLNDIGPSSFLDSIDPSFCLSVHLPPQIQLNLPVLQNLLFSFGQLRSFAPHPDNLIYHIEYFDSRDADRAIQDLDGKVLFGMTLRVLPDQYDDDWDQSDNETLTNVEFPSISTPASADADTCKKPDLLPTTRIPFTTPGSDSNLRVRFQIHQKDLDPRPPVTIPELEVNGNSTQSDDPVPDDVPAPEANTIDPTPDAICVYCPELPPPPPQAPPSSYAHYPNISDPPDTGIVYYPSLSVTPAPPTPGYEYYGAMQGRNAPGWGGYDPSSMMVPLPMGMNIGMGMGMPLQMGVNMNMGMHPPHHAHGYVAPYGHPPPHPHSQYQPQYANMNGVYAHFQNQRLPGCTPTLAASSVNGSYQGRGSSPPVRYKDREKEKGCSCSRGDAPVSASTTGVHYTNDGDETCPVPADVNTGNGNGSGNATAITPACAPSERNQLNIKRIEEGLDTRTTVMIKNIPNKMSDRDLMTFIDKVCSRRIDFFYLRMDFQNGCNVGYAFVNFIHVQDLLRFAKARLGVKWNMFSSEKVLQMSYANYQGKEALVEKFKNSAIMDEREAWRPRIFYSSGGNQGLPEPFPPPTHMRRKERSFFNRGALFVPGGGGGGGGMEGRRGIRAGNGNGKDGNEGLLTMRNLSGMVAAGGLSFGKSWMGRMTRNGVGVGVEEGEGEEAFGGGV